MFENTYLVTDKLATFTHADIDAAETELGTRFPDGYREYMTTFGKGEYCNYINVSTPQMIVKDQMGEKPPLQQFCNSWDGSEFGITPERLAKAILLGNSIDGDWIIFEAGLPDAVYVLPESEYIFYSGGLNLLDALDRTCKIGGRSEFRYFNSHINQKQASLPRAMRSSLEHFRDWVTAVGEYDHLDIQWDNTPSITLDMYTTLKLNMGMVAPELSNVVAFYKSFGGFIWAESLPDGGLYAELVHDADKDMALMQKILAYLRSKAA